MRYFFSHAMIFQHLILVLKFLRIRDNQKARPTCSHGESLLLQTLRTLNKIMKNIFLLLVTLATASPILQAVEPVLHYPELLHVLKTEKSDMAVRKKVVRRVVDLEVFRVEDGDGYMVKLADEVFFLCGDKAVPGFDRGHMVATVISYRSDNPDSNPVFTLGNCKVTPVSKSPASLAPAAKVQGGAAVLYHHPGSKDDLEQFQKKAVLSTIVGKIAREKDPSGWRFDVVPEGKAKAVRITYEGSDKLSGFLGNLEGKAVSISGMVGTFPDGAQAFESAKPITISAASMR